MWASSSAGVRARRARLCARSERVGGARWAVESLTRSPAARAPPPRQHVGVWDHGGRGTQGRRGSWKAARATLAQPEARGPALATHSAGSMATLRVRGLATKAAGFRASSLLRAAAAAADVSRNEGGAKFAKTVTQTTVTPAVGKRGE